MITRRLRRDENGALSAVECICFAYSANIKEASEHDLTSEVYGTFLDDDKTLTSAVFTAEYQTWCGDTYFPSVGIGGVATLPQYRRLGGIRSIMDTVFAMAPERNWVTSFLYPFSFDYYRQFGYERVFKVHKVTCPKNVLDCCPRNCDVKLYTADCPEVRADAIAVYNAYARRHGMMFRRDERTRAYSGDPHGSQKWTYVHYDAEGKADACATVHVGDGACRVKELCYTGPAGLRGMLGFLRAFDGQINEYKFDDLPSTAELDAVLHNYIDIEYHADSCGMGRILLLETLLKASPYPVEKGHFRLRCDDTLEWNRAVWDVEYADGKAEVTKLPWDSAYDVASAMAPLSRMILSGGFTSDTAVYLDGVDVKNGGDFFRAFPKTDLYIHDRF